MQQIQETTNITGVYVMGATNSYDELDEGLTRDGRFGQAVFLKSPDIETIRRMLSTTTQTPKEVEVVEKLAQNSLGLSKAAIMDSMQEATTRCLLKGLIKKAKPPVTKPEKSQSSKKAKKSKGKKNSTEEKEEVEKEEVEEDLVAKAATQCSEAFWEYLGKSLDLKNSILKKTNDRTLASTSAADNQKAANAVVY